MSWVLQNVVHNLTLLDLEKYSGVMSYTLLWLEQLSTFEDEVRYIWPSRWSLMKTVFLINRYSPMIDATLNISMNLYTTNPNSCKIQTEIFSGTYVIGSFASEAIIMARTLALYDSSYFVVFAMSATGLGIVIPSIIICYSFLTKITYPDAAILRLIGGCIPTVEDRPVWVLYMCLIISETVVVLLTFYKMWQTHVDKTHRSPLVHTMYRDGALYYILLLAVSVLNLCFMLLAPQAASGLIQMPFRIIHSALCSRVLLNLRKVAAKLTDMSIEDFRQSRIAFGPGILDRQHSSYLMDLELDTLEDYR
ncbi:hypothetical protein VTO73DRAFT_7010 [Trametes versicolor]